MAWNAFSLPGDKLKRAAYWLTPPLFGLVLYFPGLTAWFQKDDFAWLSLRRSFDTGQSIWWVLFQPLAQGTVRTLSQRVLYFSFVSIFGMNPAPYHVVALLTFTACSILLTLVCSRLTGSRAAGFCAAMLWVANSSLAVPMAWAAVYYELMWAMCALLMLFLMIRYAETGRLRFYFAHLAVFLLGFLVLELNVVWPAIATAYAFLYCRRIVWKVVPLLVLSAAYTAIHLAAAPLQKSGVYQLHWDLRIFSTLLTYFNWTSGPAWGRLFGMVSSRERTGLSALIAAALVTFLMVRLRGRDVQVLFFLLWFLIVLAPLLPLRDHMSWEYLTTPSIGLAMLGGFGIVSAWRAGLPAKALAAAAVAAYVGTSLIAGRLTTQSFHDHGDRMRDFIQAVTSLAPPGKILYFTGVDPEIWFDVGHGPFRLFGNDEVYLLSESDPGAVANAVRERRAMILDASGGRVRNVTPGP